MVEDIKSEGVDSMSSVLWTQNGVFPFGIKDPFSVYTLEFRRVRTTVGIFSKKTVDLDLKKISGIEMRQSVFGRLFHYGTIVLVTWGKDVPDITMTVKNPERVRRSITNAIEKVQPHGKSYQYRNKRRN